MSIECCTVAAVAMRGAAVLAIPRVRWRMRCFSLVREEEEEEKEEEGGREGRGRKKEWRIRARRARPRAITSVEVDRGGGGGEGDRGGAFFSPTFVPSSWLVSFSFSSFDSRDETSVDAENVVFAFPPPPPSPPSLPPSLAGNARERSQRYRKAINSSFK